MEWGEQWVEEAALARHRGDLDAATDNAARAEEAAANATTLAADETDPWRMVRTRAQLERGVAARLRGDPEASARLLASAQESARKVADQRLLGDALREAADASVRQGAVAEAEAKFKQAEEAYRGVVAQGGGPANERADARADEGLAMCQRGLAAIARQRGDHAAAQDHLATARDAFQRSGSRWGVAVCLNDLAEIHRHAGELAEAEELYREAVRRQEAIGSANVFITQINLALVLMARADHLQARPILEGALDPLRHAGRRAFQGAVHACLLPCTIAPSGPGGPGPDWPAWRLHAEAAAELLAETGMVDVDLGHSLQQAGDFADALGHSEHAQTAWRLALLQWEALDRQEEATALRSRLPTAP